MPTLGLKHISDTFYSWACLSCGREFDKDPRDLPGHKPNPPERAFREHCAEAHPGEPIRIPQV